MTDELRSDPWYCIGSIGYWLSDDAARHHSPEERLAFIGEAVDRVLDGEVVDRVLHAR